MIPRPPARASAVMDNVMVVLGAGLVILDYVIKFLAIGVLPSNRKPSSAMAWLILILIIPLAGFVIFLFLGRTNLGRGRLAGSARPTRPSARPPSCCPATTVAEPAYLASMATLNHNLGSLPLQDGNRVDLIPGYRDAINAMTAEVETAPGDRRGRVLHRRLGRGDGSVVRGAGRGRRRRGVKVRLLFDHMGSRSIPGYAEFEKRLDASGIEWRPMLPVRPLKGQFQRPDLRNHRKLLVVDGTVAFMGSQNLIEPGYNKAEQPQGRAGVRRARRAHRRADGQRPARGLREGLVHRDPRAHGRGDRRGRRRPPRRRGRRPGAAERAGVRHREQPAPVHRPDLLGADADLGDEPVLRPRRAAAVRLDHRRPAGSGRGALRERGGRPVHGLPRPVLLLPGAARGGHPDLPVPRRRPCCTPSTSRSTTTWR